MRKIMIVLAAFLVSPAWAAPAKLVQLSGKAQITRAKGNEPAAVGALLVEGEAIATGKDGTAVLELDDGSQVKLVPSSRVAVSDLKNARELRLEAGGVFAKAQPQPAGKPTFRIRTRSAVMGVRGTQFFAALGRKKGAAERDVWMCVNEGQVEVETTAEKKKVAVNAGQGVIVPEGKNVTPPKEYAWTKKLDWEMSAKDGAQGADQMLESAYKDLLNQNYD